MPTMSETIRNMRDGSDSLHKMASALDFKWDPDERNLQRLHNMYIRNLLACYSAKISELTATALDGIETQRYLMYALAGRSLIECAATLRYYVLYKYAPLLDRRNKTYAAMKELLDIDDQHLRGTRFDWEAFVTGRHRLLLDDVARRLANKRGTPPPGSNETRPPQVNTKTCLDKWAAEEPKALVAYDLFCDLVHPNVGSSFLVASFSGEQLFFSPGKGESLGAHIAEDTLPLLYVFGHTPFKKYLVMLMATMWEDDELQ